MALNWLITPLVNFLPNSISLGLNKMLWVWWAMLGHSAVVDSWLVAAGFKPGFSGLLCLNPDHSAIVTVLIHTMRVVALLTSMITARHCHFFPAHYYEYS